MARALLESHTMNSFVTLATAINDKLRADIVLDPALVAFAMFHAKRDDLGTWTFSLVSGSASTFDEELTAMTALADTLPWPTVLIGRSPETRIYQPMMHVVDLAPAPLKFHLAGRVARAFGGLIVDLDAGRSTKPRLTESREPDVLRDVLRCEVVDDWFEFLRGADGLNIEAAKAATGAWLAKGADTRHR